MPAVARGSTGGGARTARSPSARSPAKAPPPARGGLDPRLAPALAVAVLVAGGVAALGTGHRLHKLEVAAGDAMARALGHAGL
ncbi:MAG: hypothetical protein INR64_16585, partial [Caulobacteraceae bacterium]|nr:hypothetical protein [Caulobacter sp.]